MPIPKNAYLNSSGNRWECERGYYEEGNKCKAINVPANGFLTGLPHESGWDCERGYKPVKKDCVAIAVPKNGYLKNGASRYTSGWQCERGYREVQNNCIGQNNLLLWLI